MVNIKFVETTSFDGACDFVYNCFYLTHPLQEHAYIVLTSDDYCISIPYYVDTEGIHLGIWLRDIPKEILRHACHALFVKYPQVGCILYQNSLLCLSGKDNCVNMERNHWKILLPKNADELHDRLSGKKRYNVKRQKRIAQEQLGDYCVLEYTVDNVPEEVINTYFAYKKHQFGTDYQSSAAEYLEQYYVSHIYVLRFSTMIGAVVMSCEQGAYVYLENLAYNPEYGKYSLGAILYDLYLEKLISKGKKGIYLEYGQHQYKAMYGAVEQQVYSGTVYRSKIRFTKEVLIPKYYRQIRRIAGTIKRKIQNGILENKEKEHVSTDD